MSNPTSNIRFKAKLLRPAEPLKGSPWTFLVLPKRASEKLPTRGMTTVEGIINGHPFRATLEPDSLLESGACAALIGLDSIVRALALPRLRIRRQLSGFTHFARLKGRS